MATHTPYAITARDAKPNDYTAENILNWRETRIDGRVSESAEALAIRQAGESSILASIAGVVSQGMTEVLRWVYWWNSTEDEPAAVSTETVQLQVNADFDTSPLSANDILALVQA